MAPPTVFGLAVVIPLLVTFGFWRRAHWISRENGFALVRTADELLPEEEQQQQHVYLYDREAEERELATEYL